MSTAHPVDSGTITEGTMPDDALAALIAKTIAPEPADCGTQVGHGGGCACLCGAPFDADAGT